MHETEYVDITPEKCRTAAEWLLAEGGLSEREWNFVTNMTQTRRPTQRQLRWLRALIAECLTDVCKSAATFRLELDYLMALERWDHRQLH